MGQVTQDHPLMGTGGSTIASAPRTAPLLAIDGLSKTYPGQVALANANLVVRHGEVHAIVGQNGSGKSTLIKLLGGYVKADRGSRVMFGGEPIDLWSASPEQRRRIRIVHQDLGLVPTLSTIENLGLGRGWSTGFGAHIQWSSEAARAQADLLRFGLAPDVRQPVSTLSAAERAAVAIVRALRDWRTDEPGLLILDEVLQLADRVTVLRDGRVVASGIPATDLTQDSLVEFIVGRSIGTLYAPRETKAFTDPVLDVEAVSGITLRGLTLRAHRGEVVGVAGLVGSGRDELCGCIFGATPRFAGKVLVNKHKVFATPRDAVRAGIAFVPADRKSLGLIPEDRLVEHIPLPRYGPLQSRGRLLHRAVKSEVTDWVQRLDVQPPTIGRRMEKFSGGNQQKAVLARWLRTEPKVLLLDEPTQGVDVGAKSSIYRTIAEVVATGVAVVLSSSDAEELVNTCDRVLVFRGGMLAAELTGHELTEERVVAETLGAASNRKATRVRRRNVATVSRVDEDRAPELSTDAALPTPVEQAELVTERSGRLAAWTRHALRRWRQR